jgi:hypothetical protein
MTLTAGFFAASQLIKLGLELNEALAGNPGMTEAERADLVASTQDRARSTVDGWNTARGNSTTN